MLNAVTWSNVAVTIETKSRRGPSREAFSTDIQQPDVADRSRPVWVVDAPPSGGETAYTNTWALGALRAGETKRFVWRVTAVRPGAYRVGYAVSPGLTGRARPKGKRTEGSFKVRISPRPRAARVDEAGNVVRGASRAQ